MNIIAVIILLTITFLVAILAAFLVRAFVSNIVHGDELAINVAGVVVGCMLFLLSSWTLYLIAVHP